MADSLADRAVHALSMVSSMTDDIHNESEERHIVFQLKRSAEKVMSDAFVTVTDLAYQAKNVSKTFKELKEPTP